MGMNLSNLVKQEKPQRGAQWREYGGGLRLHIAPLGSREYDRALAKAVRGRRSFGGKVSDDAIEEATMEATAKAVLIGWDGLEDAGAAVPYSAAKALEIFKANYAFYKGVLDIAAVLDMDEAEAREADLGNSSKS